MPINNILISERLILRPLQEEDLHSFAKLNADPKVMEYFPKLLTMEESYHSLSALIKRFDQNGWGYWAVELKYNHEFIGIIGLNRPDDTLPCSPCVEIGWRLMSSFWGNGYAVEGAKAALDFGFDVLNLDEIVAFTYEHNNRSQRVMQKLKMKHHDEYFNHPLLAEGHRLSRHILYRLTRADWHFCRKSL